VSSYYNLNSVSRTLASRIWNGIKDDPHLRTIILSEGQIVHHLPKEAPDGQAQISIYLYNVSEMASMRNQPPTATTPPTLLYLNLRYLITPQTFNAENDMVLFGKIMQLFAETPVLRGADLQGSLSEAGEDLRIVLEPLAAEDLAKLWEAFQAPYRLGIGYSVFPIRIEAQTAPQRRPIIGIIKKPDFSKA
jgi:hypothetical protein